MTDAVAQWLEQLGLGKYAKDFAEHEISLDALRLLTAEDLKELGLPLGPRKLIAAALAELPRTVPNGAAPVLAPRRGEAERRQITVMFADLVGSTALAATLDPEAMRDVLLRYQAMVAEIIGRFEGYVAKYMGDGVLAYFGFPVAHEDDAERATRAGLAIARELAATATTAGDRLAARVGIATGVVVVGDLIGEGAAREEAVIGETPNLAARLQAAAAPGQVVVGEATRRLLGDMFELDDLGGRKVKGLQGPVRAYAVHAERAIESRFEARQGGRLAAIVGRDQEQGLLLDRWRRACHGEGQAVLLTGEAGIGKSRIVRALLDNVEGQRHIRIRCQCSPYHTGSPLHPVIEQLRRAAGFTADDTNDMALDKLEALLGRATAEPAAAAQLVAVLLGLAGEARYGRLELSPQRLRARTLEVLAEQLVGLARVQPVLFIVEDAHWIDPTTLELLTLCIDRMADARVLLLVSARPTFAEGLGHQPIVTSLALSRLGRADTAAIATDLAGGRQLPDALIAEITARTDGVPLFIEELTKAILESGLLRTSNGAYVLDGPTERLAIPSSLQDSLMARLDRMLPVKEVAQTAACIGREFDHGLLESVLDLPGPALVDALDRLAEAELIFRHGRPPEATYLFKHALVRDAAYASLLKSRRRAIHARIAAALAEAGAEPHLLGHHAREAGQTEPAIDHFQAAGRLALERPAFAEAIAYLREAQALVTAMGEGPVWLERRLELQVQLGHAHMAGFGYAAAGTAAEFLRAMELLQRLGSSPQWLAVYHGNWAGHFARAELPDALRLAEEMTEIAETRQDAAAIMAARRMLGTSALLMGRFAVARDHLERVLALYEPDRHRRLAQQIGQEPGCALHCYLAMTRWALGDPARARQHGEAALAIGRELGHPLTLVFALGHNMVVAHHARDHARTRSLVEETIAFSEQNGIRMWEVYARCFCASVENAAGRHAAALAALEAARPGLEATGTRLFLPMISGFALEALIALGRLDEADRLLNETIRRIERSDERWNESDIMRLAGELRLAQGDPAAAEGCFRQALDCARAQEAGHFALRAAMALTPLLADRGRTAEARSLLAPLVPDVAAAERAPDGAAAVSLLASLG